MIAHQRGLAEQALDQVHRQARGLVVLIESGVELDDLERAQTAGVGDHLHAQLRLAVVGSTGDGGAHAGSDFGIEEIDVEGDVEVRVLIEPRERLLHHAPHRSRPRSACRRSQARPRAPAAVPLVHRAHADLADVIGVKHRREARQVGELARADAAKTGDRHPVQVPRGRDLVGVEIGMGIEPKHPQPLSALAAETRHRRDAARGEAMVAAEQDRQTSVGKRPVVGIVHHRIPGGHFAQVPVTVDRRLPGIEGPVRLPRSSTLRPRAASALYDPGHTQRLRPHRGAAVPGTDVGGRADQGDRRKAIGAARRALMPVST